MSLVRGTPATRLMMIPCPGFLLPQIVACSTLDIYANLYNHVQQHLLVCEGVNCECLLCTQLRSAIIIFDFWKIYCNFSKNSAL